MAMKRISLAEFMAALRAEVEAFEAHWMKERAKDPSNWPLSQPTRADWEDQFRAWVETKEGP